MIVIVIKSATDHGISTNTRVYFTRNKAMPRTATEISAAVVTGQMLSAVCAASSARTAAASIMMKTASVASVPNIFRGDIRDGESVAPKSEKWF